MVDLQTMPLPGPAKGRSGAGLLDGVEAQPVRMSAKADAERTVFIIPPVNFYVRCSAEDR